MISIRKSVNDLERLDELAKREDLSNVLLDCYALAIHSSAHYAVEVEPGLAVELRDHLKRIEEHARAAVSADQMRAAQTSFRGELRDYRDKSAEQLTRMRNDLQSASAAMQIFADTVTSNGKNHQQEVSAQLRALQSTAKSNNISEIRGGIGAAVTGVESSIVQMQRSNQLVIAQLQDEIRVLHQQIDQERKALYTDRASGAWNRQKIDTHLDNLLRQNQPFCLLLVCVRNFTHLENQHSRTVVEGTLKALIMRFATIIGEEGVIGRWNQEKFAAVLDMPAARAVAISAETAGALSGSYAVHENGLAHKVTVQATAGIVERPAGVNASSFHAKLDQLAGAISGT